jgi:hypothetical protein
VKEVEIICAVRRFHKAIAAYGELERDLARARQSLAEVAERYPALALAHRLFERAAQSLQVIGAAVADVPGLAGELALEQQRLTRLRTLAERSGIPVRYDLT